MKTKTLKVMMVAAFLVLLPFSVHAYDVEINGIYYNVIKKGKAAEVTSGENQYTGEVIIPKTIEYDGVICSVTSIGLQAFCECSSLISVVIPNSVTSIGGGAFSTCTGLTSVVIPNSVSSIGEKTFYLCSGLISVSIGNSVTSIGKDAFSGCNNLTSVNIPNSVTSIGMMAFSNCRGLTSVNIPNSVTSIGDYAFRGCNSLTSVTIGNSVTSIGYAAFLGCSGLTSVNIPNSVTSIGQSAFGGCSLTSVTIPNSVTSIDYAAFSGCSGLTSVTIGSGVQAIQNRAFSSNPELTDVYCYATNIPVNPYNMGYFSETSDMFADSYIEYATLHVPQASLEAYKTTEPWSGFGTIVPLTDEETGIESVTTEKKAESFFTLDGKAVDSPQKGVNIIRMENGKTKKVYVR